MKNFSAQLVFKEMPIKTTVKYHYTSIRMDAIWKKLKMPSTGEDLLLGLQNNTATLQNSSAFSFIKLNLHLSYNPELPFLGIYPSDVKNYVLTKIYTLIAS